MLSRFSVKKPYTVIVGIVLVIILGVVSLSKMSTDLLPSIPRREPGAGGGRRDPAH